MKSFKRDNDLNLCKLISENTSFATNLINGGIKIDYIKYKVKKYLKKPKLLICFNCGKSGHID